MGNNACKRRILKLIFAVLIVIIAIPFLLYIILTNIDFTQSKIGVDAWLQFLGSYIGGAIGGFCAIIVLIYTLSHYRTEYELTQKQISFSERETRRQRLVDVRPFLKITEKALLSSKRPHNEMPIHNVDEFVYLGKSELIKEERSIADGSVYYAAFELKNIGNGPALNIRIISNPEMDYKVDSFDDGGYYGKFSYDLAKEDTVFVSVAFHVLEDQKTWVVNFGNKISCVMTYTDIYGNEINQEMKFTLLDKTFTMGYEAPYYVEPEINELVMKLK